MNRTVAAFLATAVFLAVASPVVAQDDDASPDATTGRVELALLDQTFDLAPGGDIELIYRITGDLNQVTQLAPPTTTTTTTSTSTTVPVEPPEPVSLGVRVLNYDPIDADADLDDIIGPDPRRTRLPDVIDGIDLLDVRSDITVESPTSATLTISVPTDTAPSISEQLEFNDDGIHPILVELRVDGIRVAEHGTVVEWHRRSADVPPPIDLALFARAPETGPSAPAAARRDAVETFAELLDLAGATGPSIALDVAPSVVTDLASGGRLTDEVTDPLADDEFLSAPATPFDISSAAAVDRVDAFRRQLVAGEDDVFAALGEVPIRTVWHPTTPLSGDGAQVMRDLGVRYLAMTADLFDTTVADIDTVPGRDLFVPVTLPDGTTLPVLIIDDEFGATFTTEATDEALAEWTTTEWSVATVARMRLDQLDTPSDERLAARSRLVAAPGFGAFDPRLVDALERFAEATDAIRFSPASALPSITDTAEVTDTLTLPETAGPSLEARLERIAEVKFALDDTASMLPPDDERPPAWERRLDSFVSTAFGDEEVNEELDELLAEAAVLRGGVVAPDPFTFTLTGDGEIPVRIGNTLDEPLDVVLKLSSPRLSFPDGDITVTLAPNDTTVVTVPIEIRSNGTSAVTVDVTTPLGFPLIEPVVFTSRVNALTGLAQVLTGAFLLVLITWWISHWRARRRDAPDTTPDSGPDTEAVAAG